MARKFLCAALISVLATPVRAQTGSVEVRDLSQADEIALARSAAPAHVSDDATVLVLRDGRFIEAVEGTTPVTCMVARSRPGSLEPICYDAEAARTVMGIELRRHELRWQRGMPEKEVDARIAREIEEGKLAVPSRPAMSYMMSAGQELVSDDGRSVGSWLPHLMIYYPYLSAEDLGLFGPPNMEAAAVFDEGKPTAHIVIAVRSFVDPKVPSAGSR